MYPAMKAPPKMKALMILQKKKKRTKMMTKILFLDWNGMKMMAFGN
jgi:hypothetical protein